MRSRYAAVGTAENNNVLSRCWGDILRHVQSQRHNNGGND